MLGCGSSSSKKSKSSATSSNFLTIQKSPSLGVPISINQKFSIVFSSDINPATVNSSTVYIKEVPSSTANSNYYAWGSFLSIAANEIIVTPYRYFSPNLEYQLVVTTGIKDIHGKSLAQNYVYQFKTQNDSINNATLSLGSTKPSDNSTANLVNTDIVMDFNKNLSSQPEYDNGTYLRVTDVNGTEIAGKTEVFNRLLKFTPNNPLPYSADINVTLSNTIDDIYGSSSYSAGYTWHFQTRDLNSTPNSSLGFKSLASLSLGKTAYLLRTIKNTSTESTIAVSRDGGIDLYKVKYPSPQSKPTFEYISSYALSSKVNAMVGFSDKYLLVGTMSQGVKVLDTTTNPISDVGDYNTTASIYGVTVIKNFNKAYAVGPTFGLQVYDLNSTTGVLIPSFAQSSSVLGEALDVASVSVYDTTAGKNVQKIYVADYKGPLVILDENASLLSSLDMNFSTKKIIVQKDYNGGNLYLSLLSASGINKQMNFDGTEYGSLVDLTKSANDMLGYTFQSTSYAYCAVGSDGISISNASSVKQLISTSGNAVSLDFVKGNYNGITLSFFVTLNNDGLLQVFNANYDDKGPAFYGSSVGNKTNVAVNSTIALYISDDYLDVATMTPSNFSIKDINTSSEVNFTIFSGLDNLSLKPTNNLIHDHNYSIKISPNISDMLGNKFNNGVEKIINFQTVK